MPKRITLSSVEQIISTFGGTLATAEWAGVVPSAVSNWLDRGIPSGWHYRLDRELRRRGYEVDPAVFGYVDAK